MVAYCFSDRFHSFNISFRIGSDFYLQRLPPSLHSLSSLGGLFFRALARHPIPALDFVSEFAAKQLIHRLPTGFSDDVPKCNIESSICASSIHPISTIPVDVESSIRHCYNALDLFHIKWI